MPKNIACWPVVLYCKLPRLRCLDRRLIFARLYGGRQLSDLYFNYRVSNHQDYLDSLYKERDATIEKLKQATKYNSTQQLLEKYGSPQPQQKGSLSNSGKKQTQQGPKDGKPDRVFVNPPPTANIQRGPPATVNKPAGPLPSSPQNPRINPPPTSPKGPPVTEEFAPNAFPAPLKRQSSTASYRESRWYDRILDALLGEDETQAKNRFALICQHCHLVNGQAPPGAQTLEDVGLWRCQGCKQMNGVQSPTEKLLEHVEKIDDHHSPIGTELSGAGSDSASADEKE